MLCHCYGWASLVASTARPQQSSWARLPAVTAVGSHFWLSPLLCSSAYGRERARACYDTAETVCCSLAVYLTGRARV